VTHGVTLDADEPAHDVLDTAEAGPAAIRGSALRMGAFGISTLLALASAPLLFRHLGVEDFGRYVLVNSVVGLIGGVTDAGLGSIALREYVQRNGKQQRAVMRDILGLRLILSLIALLAGVAFTAIAGYGETLVIGAAVAGFAAVLGAVQMILTTPLVSGLRFGLTTVIDLARQIMVVALMVALVVADASLVWFLAIAIPVNVVLLVVTGVFTRGDMPLLPGFNRETWGPLVRGTLTFAAASAVTAVYFRVALVILSLYATALETGYYATSYRIIEVVLAIPALLVSSAFPVLSRAAEQDEDRLAYAVGRILEVACILGIWFLLCLEIGATVAIRLIAGDEAEPAIDVLRIQGIAVVATFIVVACAFPLLSLHRHKELLWANLAALAGSVVLSLLLAPAYGAEGVAIATVAAEVVLAAGMALLLRRARKSLAFPVHILPPIVLAAGLASLTLLVDGHEILRVVGATIIYFGTLQLLGVVPKEIRAALRIRRETPE
jgi:O-antigen/teichoic acid export membrane protein